MTVASLRLWVYSCCDGLICACALHAVCLCKLQPFSKCPRMLIALSFMLQRLLMKIHLKQLCLMYMYSLVMTLFWGQSLKATLSQTILNLNATLGWTHMLRRSTGNPQIVLDSLSIRMLWSTPHQEMTQLGFLQDRFCSKTIKPALNLVLTWQELPALVSPARAPMSAFVLKTSSCCHLKSLQQVSSAGKKTLLLLAIGAQNTFISSLMLSQLSIQFIQLCPESHYKDTVQTCLRNKPALVHVCNVYASASNKKLSTPSHFPDN